MGVRPTTTRCHSPAYDHRTDDPPRPARRPGGHLVASCRASLIANGREVWVAELVADARVRRTGVGRALMAHVEDWARAQGSVRVTLATSRAHDFYRALDYDAFATYFRKKL